MSIYTEPGPRPNPFNQGIQSAAQNYMMMMLEKRKREEEQRRYEAEKKMRDQERTQAMRGVDQQQLVNQYNFGHLQNTHTREDQDRTLDKNAVPLLAQHYDIDEKTLDSVGEKTRNKLMDQIHELEKTTRSRKVSATANGTGSTSTGLTLAQSADRIDKAFDYERKTFIQPFTTELSGGGYVTDFGKGPTAEENEKKLQNIEARRKAAHVQNHRNFSAPYLPHMEEPDFVQPANDLGVNIPQKLQQLELLSPAAQNRGRQFTLGNILVESDGQQWQPVGMDQVPHYAANNQMQAPMQSVMGPQNAFEQRMNQPIAQSMPKQSLPKNISAKELNRYIAEFSKVHPPGKNVTRTATGKNGIKLRSNGKTWELVG